jgi:hypothetical protein
MTKHKITINDNDYTVRATADRGRMAVDPDVVEGLFECMECPHGMGHFSVRFGANEDPEVLVPTLCCPRGHRQKMDWYDSKCQTDRAGYVIDRQHPLWYASWPQPSGAVEQADSFLRGLPFEIERIHADLLAHVPNDHPFWARW